MPAPPQNGPPGSWGHTGSGGPHGCSSSDSDYEDEDEHPEIYVRIKPLQPCDAAGSGQAAVEQLKATVGNLPLPPGSGGAVKRQGVEVELAGSGCRMSLVKKRFATGIYLAGS
ncbi:F-BAR domain only protein 1-like [Emydura macquarii macquarii]|uniref:F-BAR domain only protein 1-like n=1 Tax=Emydura macquarii macquarii TaxID=1129001 RepID=UPI00352A41B5